MPMDTNYFINANLQINFILEIRTSWLIDPGCVDDLPKSLEACEILDLLLLLWAAVLRIPTFRD